MRTTSSNPPTPLTGTQTHKEPPPKQSRKKTAFVANTALNSRRRPVLLRRKSSQQSSGQSSARVSPLPTPQLTSTPARESQEYFPKITTKVEKPLPVEGKQILILKRNTSPSSPVFRDCDSSLSLILIYPIGRTDCG